MEYGYNTKSKTSIKGAIGERICIEAWIKEDKLVYGLLNGITCPHCTRSLYGGSRRHFFDLVLMDSYHSSGMEVPLTSFQPTEIKTKKSLRGKISINLSDWMIYTHFLKSMYTRFKGSWQEVPFNIVFVDDETRIVYWQSLKQLLKPCMVDGEMFPQIVKYVEKKKNFEYKNDYIWFSLSQLNKLFTLSKEQYEELYEASSRTGS